MDVIRETHLNSLGELTQGKAGGISQDDKKGFCTLYLVRHGQTEWNVSHTVTGQSDSPLTEKGIRDTEETAKSFARVRFDVIFSSDLSRTVKTAEIFRADRPIELRISPALRERSYGAFEGEHWADMEQVIAQKLLEREKLSGEAYLAFDLHPEIETEDRVATRFMDELASISREYLGETVLVVTHGGTIRILLAKLGYADIKVLSPGSVSNSGHAIVVCDGKDFIIKEVSGVTLGSTEGV